MQYVLHMHMSINAYNVDCVCMCMVCSCLIVIPVHAGTLTVLKSLFSHSWLQLDQIVLISIECEFVCSCSLPVFIVLFQYPYFYLQPYPCLCLCVLYMLFMYMWSTFNPLSFFLSDLSCDCQVMQRSRELSFHQEVQFRNMLMEFLTEWVQGEILFTRDHCTHEENLHRWDERG